MENKALAKTERSYILGSRPAHQHTCSQGHTWQCNSPYCVDTVQDCPTHGGPEPVAQGFEPWRGR
jgi:hypothetical protein